MINGFESFDSYDYESDLYFLKDKPIEQKLIQNNCKNCAAPLPNNKHSCNYCGSDFLFKKSYFDKYKTGGNVESNTKYDWSKMSALQKQVIAIGITILPLYFLRK